MTGFTIQSGEVVASAVSVSDRDYFQIATRKALQTGFFVLVLLVVLPVGIGSVAGSVAVQDAGSVETEVAATTLISGAQNDTDDQFNVTINGPSNVTAGNQVSYTVQTAKQDVNYTWELNGSDGLNTTETEIVAGTGTNQTTIETAIENETISASLTVTAQVDDGNTTVTENRTVTVFNQGPTVYVGSNDQTLYAMDAVTGDEKWTFETSGPVRSSPTVVNGTVYVGSQDALYAVNASTGEQEWTFEDAGGIISSPTVAAGTVYIGSLSRGAGGETLRGMVYAVDAETGTQTWGSKQDAPIASSPAVVNGTVYVGTGGVREFGGTLSAMDATTGTHQWTFDEPTAGIVSSPAVADEMVYVGSRDSTLYAVNASTGERAWTFDNPTSDTWSLVTSSPVVVNDTVYVGSQNSNLYAVDAAMGSEVWTFNNSTESIFASPTMANGTVYVGSDNGTLHAVDVATGEQEWTFEVPTDKIWSAPTVLDGIVYVGSNDGTLYAVDADTGTEEWSVDDPTDAVFSSPTVVLDPDNGHGVGSRATQRILGHHNKFADQELWATVSGPGTVSDSEQTTFAATATRDDVDYTWELNRTEGLDMAETEIVAGQGTDEITVKTKTANGTISASFDVVVHVDDGNRTVTENRTVTVVSGKPTVYVGSAQGTLYAANAVRGEIRWTFDAPSFDSSPTVVDGTMYVGSDEGTLYAVNASIGDQTWAFDEPTGDIQSSPTVVAGTVYVEDGRKLYAVDAETGTEQWEFTAQDVNFAASPAVVDGTVYVSSDNGTLYAVDVATGRQEWSFTEPTDRLSSSPTPVNGTVYVGSVNETLYAVDADTGTRKWAYDAPSDAIRSSPAAVNGTVFIGSMNGTLHAVDAQTGTKMWRANVSNRGIRSSPTVADGVVYVGSMDSNLHARDAETGDQEWTFESPGFGISSSPTVADGTVYIGSLYAVDAETGEFEWGFPSSLEPVSSSPTVVLDPVSGHSVGSRVSQRILGHHNKFAEQNLWVGLSGPKKAVDGEHLNFTASVNQKDVDYTWELVGTDGFDMNETSIVSGQGTDQIEVEATRENDSAPNSFRVVVHADNGTATVIDNRTVTVRTVTQSVSVTASEETVSNSENVTFTADVNRGEADYTWELNETDGLDMNKTEIVAGQGTDEITFETWTESGTPTGSLDVVVHADDGNTTVTDNQTVTVATEKPAVSVVADEEKVANGEVVTFTAEVNRSDADYTWELNGTAGIDMNDTEIVAGQGTNQTTVEFWTERGTPSAPIDVVVHVDDGNTTVTENRTVTVRTVTPSVSVTASEQFVLNDDDVTFIADVNHSVADYTWELNGTDGIDMNETEIVAGHGTNQTTVEVALKNETSSASLTAAVQIDDGNKTVAENRTVTVYNQEPTVYVGSDDSTLYAMSALAGETKWTFDVPTDSIESSPIVVDGTAYVGSDDGTLYAVGAKDGSQEWTFEESDGAVTASPSVLYGTVFVGSNNGNLYAVDTESGEKVWQFEADGKIQSAPAVRNGTVYAGTDRGTLFAVDAATGDKEWAFTEPLFGVAAPTVANGTVYFGSQDQWDGPLYAVDAETGSQQWTYNAPHSDIRSSTTVINGTVYVGSDDGTLYAVDAKTGTEEWTFDGIYDINTSPTAINGTVYVGAVEGYWSDDGALYAVDAETGSPQWRFWKNGETESSPTVNNGTVYVGADDTNLYAVDAETGNQVWTSNDPSGVVKSSPTVVLDPEGGHSVGSRAKQQTLGHHSRFLDNVTIPVGVDGPETIAGGNEATFTAETLGYDVDYTWEIVDARGLEEVEIVDGENAKQVTVEASTDDEAIRESLTIEVEVDDGSRTATDTRTVTVYNEEPTVYVGSEDTTLYAMSAATGETKWTFDVPTERIDSSPTVVDGTVYVGSDDGTLYAVDAEDGSQEWAFEEPEGAVNSSPTVRYGTVFVGSEDGTLYAVDAENGTEHWHFGTDSSAAISSSPAVNNGTVYIGSDDSTLYAVNAATGEQEWAFTEPTGDIKSTPTVADGTVYVGSDDSTLYAVNALTGKQEWTYTGSASEVRASPTVVDGTVYIGEHDGYGRDDALHAVNATTGEMRWKFEMDVGIHASPTVRDETVYIANQRGAMYAVDTETGKQEWKWKGEYFSSSIRSSPTILDGIVYVGEVNSKLYAVDAETGETEWKSDAPTDDIDSSPTVVWDPENGHSVGTRVRQRTLGHHGEFSENHTVPVGISGSETMADGREATFTAETLREDVDYTWEIVDSGNLETAEIVGGQNEKEVTVRTALPDESQNETISEAITLEVQVDDGETIGTEPQTVTVRTQGTVYVGSKDGTHPVKEWEDDSLSRLCSIYPHRWGCRANDGKLYAVDDRTGEKVWAFETTGRVQSSPTVVNGTVFIGAEEGKHIRQNGTLYAVDAANGNKQWRFDAPGNDIYTSPTIIDGMVYIASDSGTLYAVSASNGSVRWTQDVTEWGKMDTSPTVVNQTVYVGAENGKMHALDSDTGEQEWEFKHGPDSVYSRSIADLEIDSSPTVVNGTVYFGSDLRNKLYALDATDGSKEWTYSGAAGDIKSSPTVVNGTVYVGSNDGTLYAVDAEDGGEVWTFDEPTDKIRSSPTVVDGTVYFGSNDETLYAVNTDDGTEKWRFDNSTDSIKSSPTVLDGTVYVGSDDGTLYAVDAATGNKEWGFTDPKRVTSSPTVVTDLEDGHSVGSRVEQRVLGHHHKSVYSGGTSGSIQIVATDQNGDRVEDLELSIETGNETTRPLTTNQNGTATASLPIEVVAIRPKSSTSIEIEDANTDDSDIEIHDSSNTVTVDNSNNTETARIQFDIDDNGENNRESTNNEIRLPENIHIETNPAFRGVPPVTIN